MANQVGTVEANGFEGFMYQNDAGNKSVSWQLASFSADRGKSVPVTGMTGEKGSPRAGAWNLSKGSLDYLRSILGARVQLGAGPAGSVNVRIPGASIHVAGYEDPLNLNLVANIESASRQNMAIALTVLAGQVAQSVARGVYARTQPPKDESGEGEAESDSVEEIAF